MKRFFAILTFVAAAVSASAYSFTEKIDRTYPLSSDGTLTLSNITGDVTLVTWDREEVRVEAEKSAKTKDELQRIELTIDAKPSEIAIKARLPHRSATNRSTIRANVVFTITVPASAHLRDIGTTNGSITVDGARGPVRAHSVNGRIFAKDLAGDAVLETVNGTITARFARVLENQKIRAATVNGMCTLELPDDLSARVDAECVNGSVSCDFPLTLTRSKRKHITGTIGTGSASIEAETVNGLVRMKKL